MSTGKVIARATLVIIAMSILSRLLGFGREVAIAHGFGATAATDAYVLAFTIPYLFMGVVGGAMAATVVPVFTEYVTKGQRDEAWKLFSSVINVLGLALLAVIGLGILLAPYVINLMAPGFPTETEKLAVLLLQIMLPSVLFLVMGNVFMGLLNANNVFGPSAFGPGAMNLGIIFSALVLGKIYGIEGLAVGTVGGAALSALIQVPFLYKVGFRWYPTLDLRHPGVRKLFSLMLPVLASIGFAQGYILIERMLASGLVEGSIAALNYAYKLLLLPQGLFVVAISMAIFPTLSRMVSEGKLEEMGQILAKGIRFIFLISIPAGVGLMILREPVIKLLFERGAFDETASHMTAVALFFYSIGLVGQSLSPLLIRGFYALQDVYTPLKITLAMVAVNVISALLLIGPLQHGGLALANSIGMTFNMLMLVWLLQRRIPGIVDKSLIRFCSGTLAAAAVMALAVYGLDGFLAGLFKGGTLALAGRVAIDIIVGALVYFAVAFLLRLDELKMAMDLGKQMLNKVRGE
ncbi:murein biosynthesis integral membrane protein MurJ [Desulfofalx alkaliphila]|uniref:murein biosynthesis integral membrane protein MurJ n=1 Tax=Desulfofalx alkaliphila TaxID=105483 RepID=UPI0004E1C9CC|nr:murein biosynthesis integral membrane protein MurJ [Desulfofalx alkaliphila]